MCQVLRWIQLWRIGSILVQEVRHSNVVAKAVGARFPHRVLTGTYFRITLIRMADEMINGIPVTDEMIEGWADEAEAGYDVAALRKRGRPTIGEGPGTVVPVRMDEALLTALNARAEREHVSRSEAIREAIRAWIRVA
ncbi:hypothetical protein G352_13395 [Rhodococcus ruber BKS 20-38]|uniref:Ribbon-helix-helix protein CopG domain-containing protein n=2 Tax=Rhodococcus ruber TaxID=1830 RepID=M2ZA23_9NOCA|nr:hypothetical protein G352_13395 [Rhodococcus ruber BKS 20-38]